MFSVLVVNLRLYSSYSVFKSLKDDIMCVIKINFSKTFSQQTNDIMTNIYGKEFQLSNSYKMHFRKSLIEFLVNTLFMFFLFK